MTADDENPDDENPDDALDRMWRRFFALRAEIATGRGDAVAVRRELRDLHARAGGTGSTHVPVFRAEVRGEIARLNAGDRL